MAGFWCLVCTLLISSASAQDVIPGPVSGYTNGQVSIAADGSATYSIEIQTAPGTAGIQPQLQLIYNSRSGDGIMGPGWSLGGLSLISRMGQTFAEHRVKRDIQMDSLDKLALDGNLLVCTKGGYGDPYSQYLTQSNRQQRITAYGSVMGMPEWYKVQTKDGLSMEFGATPNARVVNKTSGAITHWLLNKVTDTKGNYFTVTYNTDYADIRPIKIDYTGNDNEGLKPYCSVEFTYKARPDSQLIYIRGVKKVRKNLLSLISCKYGNDVVRSYKLSYKDPQALRTSSLLKSVQECGTNNQCHPPTEFTWSHEDNFTFLLNNFLTSHYDPVLKSPDSRFVLVDFNGDGFKDYFIYNPKTGANSAVIKTNSFQWSSISTPIASSYIKDKTVQAADFDADGRTDLAVYSLNSKSNYVYICSSVKTRNVNDINLSFKRHKKPNNSDFTFTTTSASQVLLADITSNGLTDIFIYERGKNEKLIYLNVDSVANLPFFDEWYTSFWSGSVSPYGNNSGIFHFDLDGDGMMDEVSLNPDNGHSAFFAAKECKKSYFPSTQLVRHPIPSALITSGQQLIIGDWHGDGVQDFGFWDKNSGGLSLFTNSGHFTEYGFSLESLPNDVSSSLIKGGTSLMATDFNLDGKSDLIWYDKSTGENHWLLNKGWGKFEYQRSYVGDPDILMPSRVKNTEALMAGQFEMGTSTGMLQMLMFDKSTGFITTPKLFGPKHKSIIEIKDGQGKTTSLEYVLLNNYSNVRALPAYRFPYHGVDASPMLIARRYTVKQGNTTLIDRDYAFANGVTHLHGRGFRGFSSMWSTDWISLKTTKTYFNTDYHYAGSNVKRVENYVYHDGKLRLINKVENDLAYKEHRGTLFAYPASTKSVRYELDGTPVDSNWVSFEYDDFGNPTRQTTEYSDGFKEILENTYENDTVNWYLGRLLKADLTRSDKNNRIQSRSSRFKYDSQTGMMIEEQYAVQGTFNQRKSVSYAFDGFGNVVNSTEKGDNGNGIESRITVTKYDSKGRFAIQTTNALGHITKSEYDEHSGLVTKFTDANGLSTIYEYDHFGRILKETLPDGNWTKTDYKLCQGGIVTCPDEAYHFIYTQFSNSPRNISFYDGFNRLTSTDEIGPDGESLLQLTQYDYKGRLWRESLPFKLGSDTFFTEKEYDALDRLIKAKAPDGAVIEFSHTALSQTRKEPSGKTINTYSDHRGQVQRISTVGGTDLYYEYDLFGNKTSTWVGNSYEITSDYNSLGQKTVMEEPLLNDIRYEYNAFGELIRKIKNNNQDTFSYRFDKLGRTIYESSPESITTYEYDGKNGIGLLASVRNSNGHENHTYYDKLSRVIREEQIRLGKTYTTSQTYDSKGRLSTYTYPSGFKIQYGYGKYDELKTINDASTGHTFWEAGSYNRFGQLTSTSMADGRITKNKTYGTLTGLLDEIDYGFDSEDVFIEQYTYDDVGNLTETYDPLGNIRKKYSYDQLRQLTSYEIDGAKTTYTYDKLGNLVQKSDLGSLAYGSSGKSAYQTQSVNLINSSCALNLRTTYAFTSGGRAYEVRRPLLSIEVATGIGGQKKEQSIFRDGALLEKRSYINSMYTIVEKEGKTTHINYIMGPDGLVAAQTTTNQKAPKLHYFLRDRLGSIRKIVHLSSGKVSSFDYDPWGKITEGKDLMEAQPFKLGFTGHEHLTQFGLIDMVGRLYNPNLGRFVSADPFVQAPTNWLSYNRYAYAFNSPLHFTDPSGYFSLGGFLEDLGNAASDFVSGAAELIGSGLKEVNEWGENTFGKEVWQTAIVVGAAVVTGGLVAGALGSGLGSAILAGAASGFAGSVTGALMNGASGSDAFKAGLEGAKWGAISAGLSYGVGSAAVSVGASGGGSAGFWTTKILGHSLVQGGLADAKGGKFEHGFLAGLASASGGYFSHGASPVSKVLIGAAAGGTASKLGGGKFGNGALSGAMVVMFNDLMHEKKPNRGRSPANKKMLKEAAGVAKNVKRAALVMSKIAPTKASRLMFEVMGKVADYQENGFDFASSKDLNELMIKVVVVGVNAPVPWPISEVTTPVSEYFISYVVSGQAYQDQLDYAQQMHQKGVSELYIFPSRKL